MSNDKELFKNNVVTNFPGVTKINFTKIDKKYLNVLIINFFIVAILLFVGLFGITKIEFKEFDVLEYRTVLYVMLSLVLLINLLLIFLEFKKRQYAVREKDIIYQRGLLNNKLITVPFNRIQHLNVTESLFSRMFKLASLHVYTAGDDSSDLVIKGLPKEKAYEIREFILQETKEL